MRKVILHLIPKCRAAKGPLDFGVKFALRQRAVEADAEGDVLIDRHGEWCRCLKHHSDPGSEQRRILLFRKDVLAVEQHFAFGALAMVEVIDTIEDPDQG